MSFKLRLSQQITHDSLGCLPPLLASSPTFILHRPIQLLCMQVIALQQLHIDIINAAIIKLNDDVVKIFVGVVCCCRLLVCLKHGQIVALQCLQSWWCVLLLGLV